MVNINLEILCDNCDKADNRKRLIIKQPHMNNPVEIWVKCDCGNEHYLCDEDDIVG
jgi:hypothetical protein